MVKVEEDRNVVFFVKIVGIKVSRVFLYYLYIYIYGCMGV